ncbi:MAG TPA: O-antigen ligase family protein [Sphingomicrobium sp.]
MPSHARSAVAPLYLVACLILGGSAQGIWQNALLQLTGVGIIALAALAPANEPIARPAKPLLVLTAAALVFVALQQIPLPPSVWAHGARSRIATGYEVLGQALPALPVSLTPYQSLSTLLTLIPPLALFCAMVRLKPVRPAWLAAALVAGSVAGILLGVLQVGTGPRSPWYLYPATNFGSAVGFFANANHMASLLVVTLPFVAALAAAGRGRSKQRSSAVLVVATVLALVLVVGIALNGSLAGFALAVPVIAASVLILLPSRSRVGRVVAGLAALSAVVAIAGMTGTAIGSGRIGQEATTAVQSRQAILETTGRAIADNMPFGSGLGSFLRVYRTYEKPDAVTSEYVIHAHNDYAELVLELGVAGVLLIVIFLVWWARAVWAVWRKAEGGPFARAASIACAALLLHSLVDFPLRTAAISACFAMFLALLADRRQAPRQELDDLRPTRHLVFK